MFFLFFVRGAQELLSRHFIARFRFSIPFRTPSFFCPQLSSSDMGRRVAARGTGTASSTTIITTIDDRNTTREREHHHHHHHTSPPTRRRRANAKGAAGVRNYHTLISPASQRPGPETLSTPVFHAANRIVSCHRRPFSSSFYTLFRYALRQNVATHMCDQNGHGQKKIAPTMALVAEAHRCGARARRHDSRGTNVWCSQEGQSLTAAQFAFSSCTRGRGVAGECAFLYVERGENAAGPLPVSVFSGERF